MPDPASSLHFGVEIDGLPSIGFTAVEGLNAEYEIDEYHEGGENTYVHRIPGRLKYQTVKLTRNVDVDSQALAAWFCSMQTAVVRGTATITAFDGDQVPVAVWNLIGVVPLRYTGPSFSVDQNNAAKESLELLHNGFFAGSGLR
jgi:phage tail-like protein